MISRSLSVHSPQMKGLWWEVNNTLGEIDCSMGRTMCDFNKYNINKNFFSSLINMNMAPVNNSGRRLSVRTFLLPKEVDAINGELTVQEQAGCKEIATMVNTGSVDLYVGQHVVLVPPLSLKDAYYATACETGNEYVFPQTFSIEPYSTEMNTLLQNLTQLEHENRKGVRGGELTDYADKMASVLCENNIFNGMDTSGFTSKGAALLHIMELYVESMKSADPTNHHQTSTRIEDIKMVDSDKAPFEEKSNAMGRLVRNPLSIWMKPLTLASRCQVEESYDSPMMEVGLIHVARGGLCKVKLH